MPKAIFKGKPLRTAAILIFLASFAFYGIFISHFFPGKIVFTKYQVAADQYLKRTISNERLLDFSPLYLYLNIFARKYTGNPYHFILWIQILLVSMAAVFLFLLLKLFFNRTLSIAGTIAFITNKSIILYSFTMEPEPLLIFFILGFVYFGTRSIIAPTGGSLLLSGLFLGLSVVTRSNFFPIALVIPIFLLIKYRDIKKWLRPVGMFGIPVLIIMSFLALRNSSIAHSFTLIQMNPGQVFYDGNNPNSVGESAIYPPLVNDFAGQFQDQADFQHVVYRHFARRIKNQPLSINQVNWFWTQKGLNFILDHPFHYFKRLLVKVNFIFHNYRRHDLEDVFRDDRISLKKFPTVPFALISALSIMGMLMSVKKWQERLLIYVVLFWQVGVMLLLYVSDRQRVVIISMMIFFAVDFVDRLFSRRKNIYMGLPVLLIFPMLYLENQTMKEEDYLWQRYLLSSQSQIQAFAERKKGNLPLAVQKNALAVAYAPGLMENKRLSGLGWEEKKFKELSLGLALSFNQNEPSALFDLGVLFLENRRLSEAEHLFKNLAENSYSFNRQYTQSSLPGFYLARIYELKGDKAAAADYLEKALKKNPGDPWVLSHLFSLTGEPVYKNKLSRYFDDIDARFFLGKALLEAGKFQEAADCFSYVAEKLPLYRKGLIYLSITLGADGQYQKAVDHYMKALALSKDPIFAQEEIIDIFKKFAGQHPLDPNAKELLKTVLDQFGLPATPDSDPPALGPNDH